jgi:hypothetical protein
VLQCAESLGFRQIADDTATNVVRAVTLSLTAGGHRSWHDADRRIAERAVEVAETHGIRGCHISFLYIGIAQYWLQRRKRTDVALRVLACAMLMADGGETRRIGLLVIGEAAALRLRTTESTWERKVDRLRTHLAVRCRSDEQLQTVMWPFIVGVKAILDCVANGVSVDAALRTVSERIKAAPDTP